MEYQLEHHHITAQQHGLHLKLLVENLQSPANYGMMIRMAESLGVEEIFCSSKYDQLTPKMKRSSRSAENNLKVRFSKNIHSEIAHFKQVDIRVIGLEYTSKSTNIKEYNFQSATKVLICGNESTGLSPDVISQCDVCIHLPMYGKNSSMNVVMAASIAFWEMIR